MNQAQIAAKLNRIRFHPNGNPTERLALINPREANLLRKIGGAGRMTKFGVRSFAPDGGADGNGGDGYSNSGASNNRSGYSGSGAGSGSDSSSGGGGRPDGGSDNSGGMGGQGSMGSGFSGSGAQGGGGQNSGGNRPDGGMDNNGGYGYSNSGTRNSGGSSSSSSGLGGLLGNSTSPSLRTAVGIAGLLGSAATALNNGLATARNYFGVTQAPITKDQSRIAPSDSTSSITSGVANPNYVTVNDVPAIPTFGQPASLASTAAALKAQMAQYQRAPGHSYSVNGDRDSLDGSNADAPSYNVNGTVADQGDPNLVGMSLGQTDPRSGYYDSGITTPETQFADRMREELQLHGANVDAPGADNAMAAAMGSFQNENLAKYTNPANSAWNIDSPAAYGKFGSIPGFNDVGYTAAGIPSWHGSRLSGARSYDASQGYSFNDPNGQAAAMAAEIAGQLPGEDPTDAARYAAAYRAAANPNIAQGTQDFMRGYENPSKDPITNHIANRVADATAFTGNFPNTSSSVMTALANGAPPAVSAAAPTQVASIAPQSYGFSGAPAARLAQVASASFSPQYSGFASPSITQQAFAAPAEDTPAPFTPDQVAAAQPDGAGFAANGQINTINPNGVIGSRMPLATQVANYIANPPYNPATAGTMDRMVNPLQGQGGPQNRFIGKHGKNTPPPRRHPGPIGEPNPAPGGDTTPPTGTTVQGPMGPAYSYATALGNYVIDIATGKTFKYNAGSQSYVPVAAAA